MPNSSEKSPTQVITGIVRLSYANVWEPKSINGSAEKYSVSLIIPKSDKKTIAEINAAVDVAIEEGRGKFGGKIPSKSVLKLPLRDGDTDRNDEAYADAYFVNANSPTAPEIVDKSKTPILTEAKSTPVYMQGCQSIFLLLIQTVIAGSPAALAISRKSATASGLAGAAARRMISTPTSTMIFCHEDAFYRH